MLHVMPFWVWILCCRLWFSEKIWHITLYLEIQKGRQSADRSQFIASACFLICINLTGLTHTETHQKKRKKKKGLSWKKMGTNVRSMNEQNIIVPKTSTVSHQTSRLSCRRQFLQPKNYKVRCKWWVSGEVRDISVRNSHFVDTAMFTRHVIEKREWQTCILCFCLWFCFLWYWQPFID